MPKASLFATILATAAVGYAGLHLARSTTPVQPPDLPPLPAPASGAVVQEVATQKVWPAVFGTVPVDAAPVAAPPPPPPTQQYFLKGLLVRKTGSWAVLADPSGEYIVKIDETLEDGSRVARIDRHGVTLERDGVLSLVIFGDAPPDRQEPAGAARTSDDLASIVTRKTQLDLTGLDPHELRRIIARAGAIEQIETADGEKALDLLWIRNGQLYDKLGLQAGDRILRINGIEAGDEQALLGAGERLLRGTSYRIDLLRNGDRHTVEVEVDRDG